jgi:hypothetical protein
MFKFWWGKKKTKQHIQYISYMKSNTVMLNLQWYTLAVSFRDPLWGKYCMVITLLRGLCGLTRVSTIFQLYRGGHFYWWRKLEYPEKTTSLEKIIYFISYYFTSNLVEIRYFMLYLFYVLQNKKCIEMMQQKYNFKLDYFIS